MGSAGPGFSWKDSVRVATAVAGALATDFEDGDTVDGIVIATGDRILLKDQAAAETNGLYEVQASGAPIRTTDADTADDITAATVFVQEGTVNADTAWVLATDNIILETTNLVFVQFGAGAAYTAGGGITLTGTVFSVDAGTGLTQDAGGLSLSANVQAALTGGVQQVDLVLAGVSTSYPVVHNWGTDAVTVTVRDSVTGVIVETDVTANLNSVDIGFAVAPASGAYTATVQGVPSSVPL